MEIKWVAPGGDVSDFRALRAKVFCGELGYPEDSLPAGEKEYDAHNVGVYEDGVLLGIGRLRPSEEKGFLELGPTCVDPAARGKGVGAAVMRACVEKAKELSAAGLSVGSRVEAVGFYENFGLVKQFCEYEDHGVRRVRMYRDFEFDGCKWLGFPEGRDAGMFRREFDAGEVVSATLSICGLGYFELYFNGKRFGDDLLVPAQSDYVEYPINTLSYPLNDELSHRIYYMKYDVTGALRRGINCMGVHVGNGWYGEHEITWEGYDHGVGKISLVYKLVIKTRDGETVTLVSDENGEYIPSFITRASIYFAEDHDYRLYPDGWNEVGFKADNTGKCRLIEAPKALMCPQDFPADKVTRTVTPVLIGEYDGKKLYDLKENLSGYTVLRFPDGAKSGDAVSVNSAEILSDGRLEHRTKRISTEIDTYIRGEKDPGLLYPRFCWHSGRYLEVTGGAEVVEYRVVHSPMKLTAQFESSDETLNWLFGTFVRTELNNLHGWLPSDCPHRERLGYTGDGQLTSRAVLTMFDSRDLFRKWTRDIACAQDIPGGHVEHTAPFRGGGGGPVGWGGAIVFVPYNYWKITGDDSLVRERRNGIKKYIDYIETRRDNGLVAREEPKGWCLGDWCAPDKIAIPEPFVNTCLYIKALRQALEMNSHLGDTSQNERYESIIDDCVKAVMREYYDASTGSFCGGIQGADAYAVDIGLGDERTLANIVKKYTALGEYDTGIFGTDILTRVLFENGRGELAFELLTNKKDVSFDYMKRHGATTLWENWDGRASHDHPMFGAVLEYLFTCILGIKQAPGKAGFGGYTVEPADIPSLEWARGGIMTDVGRISVEIRGGKVVSHTLTKE
ncbi:MAG: GNAT family N-acetyltransferase [Clostridia bacterium]|nr:GNAT family N-acetyltransferase [Clostridia bacterium]